MIYYSYRGVYTYRIGRYLKDALGDPLMCRGSGEKNGRDASRLSPRLDLTGSLLTSPVYTSFKVNTMHG